MTRGTPLFEDSSFAAARSPPQMHDTFARWPATYVACIRTYFRQETFARPGEVPGHGAYMLACLQRYAEAWHGLHEHRGVAQDTLDRAAAHEIMYIWNRGYKPQRPAAYLGVALTQLVTSRPERVLERHEKKVIIGKSTAARPSQGVAKV
jgi:hypothetical protein